MNSKDSLEYVKHLFEQENYAQARKVLENLLESDQPNPEAVRMLWQLPELERKKASEHAQALIDQSQLRQARLVLEELAYRYLWNDEVNTLYQKTLSAEERKILSELEKINITGERVVSFLTGLKAIRANAHKLNSEELDKISSLVLENVKNAIDHPGRFSLSIQQQEKLKSYLEQIAIGIIGNVLFELMQYLATYVLQLDAPEQTAEMRAREARRKEIRNKLLNGLTYEERDIFEKEVFYLAHALQNQLAHLWKGQIAQKLKASKDFVSFFKQVKEQAEAVGIRYLVDLDEHYSEVIARGLVWGLVWEAQEQI